MGQPRRAGVRAGPLGEGAAIRRTPFRVAVPAEATGGHAVCIAVDMPPGVVVDEHTHPDEDQICIVLAGLLGCRVSGVESILGAGELQVLPRTVPHALWNAGVEFVRLVEVYTPPGIEQQFIRAGARALAVAATQPAASTHGSKAAISAAAIQRP